MEKSKLQKYKEILLTEKKRLEEQIESIEREQRMSQREAINELSAYDNHPGDLGTETFERAKDLGLKDNALILLSEIEAALEKISAGSYGICQRCGDEISEERLEVMPYTIFCAECKKLEEELSGSRERPIEEEVLNPPFWGIDDENDVVIYDAEDAWQDVAQYGTSSEPDSKAVSDSEEEVFLEMDEIIGAVGIEDTIIDDEIEDLEDAGKRKSSFTGIKGETND